MPDLRDYEFDGVRALRAIDDYDRDHDRGALLTRLLEVLQLRPLMDRDPEAYYAPSIPDANGRYLHVNDLVAYIPKSSYMTGVGKVTKVNRTRIQVTPAIGFGEPTMVYASDVRKIGTATL